jgi:hypothetical protein
VKRTARNRSLLVAAVAVVAWSAAGIGTAAASGDITDVGWWSRNPLSSAPDGGFAVGSAPDGPTAVAALRFDLGGGVETLVLDVTPTTDAVALASLEVCVGDDGWTPESGGGWGDAPTTTCAGATVPFARAGDGWRADVSSLVQGLTGSASIAVVPTSGSGTVPYEVRFADARAVATGARAAPSPDAAAPAPTAQVSAAPGPGPAPSPSPAPPPISGGGALPTPAAPPPAPSAPAADPAGDAAVADVEPAEEEASSTFELANAGLLDDVGASDPRWGEALVLVLIGLAVGAAVYGSSRFSAARAA